jgi:Cu+-exporting ATPase
MDTLTLKLRGMSCAGCARNIEKAIKVVPGVTEVNVNFAAEQATVEYDTRKTNLEKIQDAVEAAGYSAYSLKEEMITGEDDAEKAARVAESRELLTKVMLGGVISVVLVIGSLSMMTGLELPLIPALLSNSWFQLVLTAPVQFWCGYSFYVNSWKALKRHAATMDTLIALGTSAAYFILFLLPFFPIS